MAASAPSLEKVQLPADPDQARPQFDVPGDEDSEHSGDERE
jgi:hypothetical protein